MTAVKQKLSTELYIKVSLPSKYIWITYLSIIYSNDSETCFTLNLFSETRDKIAVLGPLRPQELNFQLWNYHILNNIFVE